MKELIKKPAVKVIGLGLLIIVCIAAYDRGVSPMLDKWQGNS